MRITRQLFEKEVKRIQENYKEFDYYMEGGLYSLFIINKRVGHSMSLREAYKALQVLEDVLIIFSRNEGEMNNGK